MEYNKINLSKSKYCKAVQCNKILWLDKFMPEEAEEAEETAKNSILENGTEVGELAALGCNSSSSSLSCSGSSYAWTYSTSYWMKNDTDNTLGWVVRDYNNGAYRNTNVSNGDFAGVRPVLKIAESLF